MKTDFWASGNHFLLVSQTVVNRYQWKQFFIELEHIGNVETRFLSVLSIVLFRVFFFCKWKLFLKLGGSPFLKTNYIPASRNHFFQFLQRFFKVETGFPYSGNGNSFSIPFTQLVQMDFLPCGNSVFWPVVFYCYQKPLLE